MYLSLSVISMFGGRLIAAPVGGIEIRDSGGDGIDLRQEKVKGDQGGTTGKSELRNQKYPKSRIRNPQATRADAEIIRVIA
jgi:hypothetical protein